MTIAESLIFHRGNTSLRKNKKKIDFSGITEAARTFQY
jgi:hypothetical protein